MGYALQMVWGSRQAAEHIWHTGVWPHIPKPAINRHVQKALLLFWMESKRNYGSKIIMLYKKVHSSQSKHSSFSRFYF